MIAVIGEGGLAEGVAMACPAATLVGSHAFDGPFLWRKADLDTGEGVLAALGETQRVIVVLDRPRQAHGTFAVLTRRPTSVAVVFPLGNPPSALERLPEWSQVAVPPCWGGRSPLVRRWSSIIKGGGHLWIPNLGVRQVCAAVDAVPAVLAASETPGVRWSIGSESATLHELAQAISAHHRYPLRATRAPRAIARVLGRTPEDFFDLWFKANGPTPSSGGPSIERAGKKGWLAGL